MIFFFKDEVPSCYQMVMGKYNFFFCLYVKVYRIRVSFTIWLKTKQNKTVNGISEVKNSMNS